MLADWARSSELLLHQSLDHPGPLTIALVFSGGLLTSLGPCSLSLLPVTLAYLAGFGGSPNGPLPASRLPWQRSVSFAAGIVTALVLLGGGSALVGRLYGSLPNRIPMLVALVAVLMGLNLLGLLPIRLPAGPDPERWRRLVPPPLAWMAQSGRPLVGMVLLTSFGAGQVVPLLLAGTAAASLPSLLGLRRVGQWIPPISGVVLLVSGSLTLLANLP
jgi:cytochrome c-type biogenesis protein